MMTQDEQGQAVYSESQTGYFSDSGVSDWDFEGFGNGSQRKWTRRTSEPVQRAGTLTLSWNHVQINIVLRSTETAGYSPQHRSLCSPKMALGIQKFWFEA